MKSLQNTTRWVTLAVTIPLAGCAGMREHYDGNQYLAQGNRDAAISSYQQAVNLDPMNAGYRIDLLTTSQSYSADLVVRGEDARRAGRAGEAVDLFKKALKVDPTNDRARRGLMGLELDIRGAKLIAESERLLRDGNLSEAQARADAALADNPGNAAAQRQAALVREQAEKVGQERAAQAAARSVMNKPVTLQFRDANVRMVFEALSRSTGLNVILDRDVRADLKTTIFVKDAAVADTVDLILLQNQLEKRSLNANTLFIYPSTVAKLKEYQDLQVRTFQVSNIDVKYLQTVLKSVLKVKDISVDERSGTLVMRDTADTIAVAAKVIAAHDVPEPEVMLEVEVLEVSRDRLSNIGIEFPSSFNISTPDSANTLGALKALTRDDLVVSKLALGINLRLEDADSNLLASPRIRARNKEKARVLIGDRVPIITNTVTPVASGSSVVTGSVQYQDVGLKLDFEPQIYSDEEVGLRIALEVSNIVKEIRGPSGSLAYQIGTRNAQTVVRMRDGETQILAGLISAEDRSAANTVPGLGHLPVIGRLFGTNAGTTRKTEIVLSITPRIVRPPVILDASVRSVFSGTEGSVRERALQLDPVGSVQGQSSGGALQPTASGPRAMPARPSAGTTGNRAARPALPAPASTAPAADSIGAGSDSATEAPKPPTAEAPPAAAPQEPSGERKAPQ